MAEVNKNAFLKNLNKKKAAAKAATKSKRPSGGLSDEAIIARLGLTEDDPEITVPCRVTKIIMGNAKDDSARPYFRFGYSLSEDSPLSEKGKGTQVSNYHEIADQTDSEGETWRTVEEAYERLFWEFQGLGENTEDWESDPNKFILEAVERHTKAKTLVQITISRYEKRDESEGINVRVIDVIGGETENEETETDTTNDAENTDTDTGSDYADWVGKDIVWEDSEGIVEMKVSEYNEDDETFTGADQDDDEWTAPVAECKLAS